MAIKTIITKVDDIDGSPAVNTFTFTWQGTKYQIDLSKAHAAELTADMQKWVSASRRVRFGGRQAGTKNAPKAQVVAPAEKPAAKAAAKPAAKAAAKPAAKAAKPAAKAAKATRAAAKPAAKRRAAAKKQSGPDTATIRAWATAQGIKVADRGRLAPAVVQQYVKAHEAPVRQEISEMASRVEMPRVEMPRFEMPHIA